MEVCGSHLLSHASAICILKFLKGPLGQTTQLCLASSNDPTCFTTKKDQKERFWFVILLVVDIPGSRTDGESSSGIEPLACDASTQSDDSFSQIL